MHLHLLYVKRRENIFSSCIGLVTKLKLHFEGKATLTQVSPWMVAMRPCIETPSYLGKHKVLLVPPKNYNYDNRYESEALQSENSRFDQPV